MRLILPFLFFIVGNAALAQTVILEQTCDTAAAPGRYGPNRAHFVYVNGSVALPLYRGDGGRFIAWRAPAWHLGVHYKGKISEYFSFLLGLQYTGFASYLRQSGPKIFPDTARHQSQGFRSQALGLSTALRIQLGRRGNSLGRYIDVGVEGEWLFSNAYIVSDKLPGGASQKIITRGLPWYNPLQGRAFIRFGIATYAIVARCRFSPYFKNELNAPEPPRVTLGLEVGWGL